MVLKIENSINRYLNKFGIKGINGVERDGPITPYNIIQTAYYTCYHNILKLHFRLIILCHLKRKNYYFFPLPNENHHFHRKLKLEREVFESLNCSTCAPNKIL